MGFPFKSLRHLFSSGTKAPDSQNDKAEPRCCPIPKGMKATQALLNGEDSALDLLLASQEIEASRATSTCSPVAERKPYSIQPCAYPETKRWIAENQKEEFLEPIVALKNTAAEVKSSADLVKFGYTTTVNPAAPRLPKFNKLEDGFIPFSRLLGNGLSESESDGQSEIASLVAVSEGSTLVEGKGREPAVQPSFGQPKTRRGALSGPSDDLGYVSEADSNIEVDEYDDLGFWNDGSRASTVDSDTYSLNAEVVDAKAVKAAKASRILIEARARLLRKVSVSIPGIPSDEVSSDSDDDIEEIDESNEPAAEIKSRHIIKAPSPPTAPLVPLFRLHKGQHHYTSPQGRKCLAFIRSYLELPTDMPVGKLLFHMIVTNPKAAATAALANPALVQAMDDLDFTDLLGSPDLPNPPAGRPKDMSAEDKTRYWNYHLIKGWSEYKGREPEIFTHLSQGEREQIRLINDDTRANGRGFEWETEGAVSRGISGHVRLWTMEKRLAARKGKTVREWNCKYPRKSYRIAATPSYLSIAANADGIEDEVKESNTVTAKVGTHAVSVDAAEGTAEAAADTADSVVSEDADAADAADVVSEDGKVAAGFTADPAGDTVSEDADTAADAAAEDMIEEDGGAGELKLTSDHVQANADWIDVSIRRIEEEVQRKTQEE